MTLLLYAQSTTELTLTIARLTKYEFIHELRPAEVFVVDTDRLPTSFGLNRDYPRGPSCVDHRPSVWHISVSAVEENSHES